MSFELYPPIDPHKLVLEHKKSTESETRWLVENVIKPELPSLRDTLQQCHELLTSNQQVKLPLSSYQSEYIKGVVTRQSFKVVQMEIVFKNIKLLNGGRQCRVRLDTRTDPHNEIIIRQLNDCDEFILKSLKKLDEILLIDTYKDHMKMMDDIHNLLISISTSLNYLKTPNPKYLFPRQRTLSTKFSPQLPDTIALEFFVNDNDLFLEFHELQNVLVRPWCLVDQKTGLSFVDNLKMKISKERRKSISTVITEEQEKMLRLLLLQENHPFTSSGTSFDHALASSTSAFTSLFHNSSQKKLENLKYIEKCITYENNDHQKCVVMVKRNLELNIGDPLLMSVAIKLGIVENNIMKFYENLIMVIDS